MRPAKDSRTHPTLEIATGPPGDAGSFRSLTRTYIAYAAVVLVSLLAIVYFGINATWLSYVDKEQTRRSLRVVGAGLQTMEELTREATLTLEAWEIEAREPLGLGLARFETDTAITHLEELLTSAQCVWCRTGKARMIELASALAAFRLHADEYLSMSARPEGGRNIDSLMQAITSVQPPIMTIVANQISAAWSAPIDISEELALLAYLGELYERAEQLRSSLMPALMGRRHLSESELVHAHRALARTQKLVAIIGAAVQHRPDLQTLADASIQSRAYVQGQAYMAGLLESLTQSPPGDATIVEMNRQYATTIGALATLRNGLLRDTLIKVDQHATLLETQFILAVVAAVALSVCLICGLISFWNRIVHPFRVANKIIRGFIREDAGIQMPSPTNYNGVTRELFSTLSSLKEHIDFKRDLETRRDELIENLIKLSETDHLTGLLNRRAFEKCVAEFIDGWRDSSKLLAFILFDIDHFKEVNDSYGHMAGDSALAAIGEICRESCRKIDIMARVGGEEFCVVCFVGSTTEADGIAHRLRLNIQNRQIIYKPGSSFQITASFGVAVSRIHEECNTSILFGKADQLLYSAKAYGRNRVILNEGKKPHP
ncbi:putative diguanylate cyclase YedQ [compost metagenome]